MWQHCCWPVTRARTSWSWSAEPSPLHRTESHRWGSWWHRETSGSSTDPSSHSHWVTELKICTLYFCHSNVWGAMEEQLYLSLLTEFSTTTLCHIGLESENLFLLNPLPIVHFALTLLQTPPGDLLNCVLLMPLVLHFTIMRIRVILQKLSLVHFAFIDNKSRRRLSYIGEPLQFKSNFQKVSLPLLLTI